ncbi:MAG: transporter permease [Solirubrobacterales bacterium]|jgi:ribose/xylose/arabinose/galactoside ABC-type transport system permease subunit|nr:transporter permease [Solirubrobacterales bacterium]
MTAIALRVNQLLDRRSLPVAQLLLRVITAAFAAILVIGALTTEGFLSVDNVKAILGSTAFVGIIAVGITVIMLSGNLFSLSLGTTTAVCAMLFLFALQAGIVVAIVATVALGAVLGAAQGLLIGSIGANAIIVTIGAGALQEGGAVWASGGSAVFPPKNAPGMSFLADTILGVPFAVYVLVVLAVAGEYLMRRTRFGREIYLMGENKRAARAAALPIVALTAGAFAVAGACAAIAGVLIGAFNQNASLLVSGTFTYDAIAAALVGGSVVTGGRGSIARTVAGAVVIATISDLLLLRGYSTGVQILVKGAVVLVVVVLLHINQREGER